MRVIICGGRAPTTEVLDAVAHWVRDNCAKGDVVIHGAAPGVDSQAARTAERRGIETLAFPANWQVHGKAAGPIRNRQMLEEGKPDLVVAFPGGSGTENMIHQAKAAGILVVRRPSPLPSDVV